MDSILNTVKKMCGLDEDYTPFDEDIKVHINAAFATLANLGVGPEEGYYIEGPENTWTEFTTDKVILGLLRSYLFMYVKRLFDPSNSSFVDKAYESKCQELEWRIQYQAKYGGGDTT